jgi:urease accessory protein
MSALAARRREDVIKTMLKNAAVLLVSSAPGMVLAHAGHSQGDLHGALSTGFIHPFTGLDHLLMMLCVGIWAGRSGGALRWQLPAAFLLGMTGGWALGLMGATVPGLEGGIAATLIALGVVLALRLELPRTAQLAGIALGAVLHGLAHGGELGGSTVWVSGAGMLAATALLHGAGFAASRLAPARDGALYRTVGTALALAGGALLAAA